MPTKAGTRVERKVRRKGHDAPGQPAPLQGTVKEPQGKATWLVSWVSGREQTLKSRQLVIIRNPGSSVGQPAAQRQPETHVVGREAGVVRARRRRGLGRVVLAGR